MSVEDNTTDTSCPNQFCDDALVDLPKARRLRIFGGTKGSTCMVEFPADAKGFVVFDGDGAIVTERPCVEIPIAKAYSKDPDTGALLTDGSGNYIEAPHPGWQFAMIIGGDGCQNRIAGLDGIPANYHWDGCKFILKPTEDSDTTIDDYQHYSGWCGIYEAVFKETEICDPLKGNIKTFALGYRPKPATPYGQVTMFGGPTTNIPDGYLYCNGQGVSTSEYPDLFAAIGYAHGGSGTIFNLPDMRGRVPRGMDDGAGRDPNANDRAAPAAGGNDGDAVGSVQEDSFQCHGHDITGDQSLSAHVSLGFESTTTGGLGDEVAYGPQDNHGTQNEDVIFDPGSSLTITDNGIVACDGEPDPRVSSETRMKNLSLPFIIFAGCKVCN